MSDADPAGDGAGGEADDADPGVGDTIADANADAQSVAVLRPDDGRLAETAALVASLGARPVRDPMLAVEPTGATPEPADFVVLTSAKGVDLASEAGWTPGDATLCCIGDATAAAARDAGWSVDVVPGEFSSAGLVAALADRVAGARVEVARSDHGSPVLTDGLTAAGADVHETVLYRLVRPDGAGTSAARAAAGDLDGVAFTSSLMVDNWVAAAADRGVREAALAGLRAGVVGAIGAPTRDALAAHGVDADVVPGTADVEALVRGIVDELGARADGDDGGTGNETGTADPDADAGGDGPCGRSSTEPE